MVQEVFGVLNVRIAFENESFSLWRALHRPVRHNLLKKNRFVFEQYGNCLIGFVQFCADVLHFGLFHGFIGNADLYG